MRVTPHPMAIIWPCPLSLSTYAAGGRQISTPVQSCPSCGHPLGSWGGYWRWVRAERQPAQRIWIRRGWCGRCRRTQALLPSFLFARRLDTDGVIGAALAQAAAGWGARRVAEQWAVPHTTVRDWWRRVTRKTAFLLSDLLALAMRLDPAPVALTENGVAAVLETLSAAWVRARERVGGHLPDRWGFWSVVSGGRALAPHTSPP